jgi:biopolymer transport protein TolR
MSPAPLPRLTREPNVVPMIDVLLVLLIIFMVATAAKRRALDVQLPPARSTGATGTSIVLGVDPGGRYTLNGTRVEGSALRDEITRVFRDRPEKILFVRGAPTMRYQEVVHAFDVARGAGVRVLGIVPGVP